MSLNLESNDALKFNTVPSKLDPKQLVRDELDELIRVEREWKDHKKPYQTLPNNISLSPSEPVKYPCRLMKYDCDRRIKFNNLCS